MLWNVVLVPQTMQLSKKTINIKAYLLFKDFFLMLVCKTNLKMSVSKKKKKKMSVSGRPVRILFRE